MKLKYRSFGVRGIGESSENGLSSVVIVSPGELVKALALGLTAMLLFS